MKNTKLITAILSLGMLSTGALAHQHTGTGFYVGFEGGVSSLDGHCDSTNSAITVNNAVTTTVANAIDHRAFKVVLEPAAGTTATTHVNVVVYKDSDNNATVAVNYPTCDESSTSFKGIAGYQFNENLAVEGFYSAASAVEIVGNAPISVLISNPVMGISDLHATRRGGTINVGIKDEVGVSSFGLNGKGQYEVSNNFLINGRLGVHFWNVSHDYTRNTDTLNYISTATDNPVKTINVKDDIIQIPTTVEKPVEDESGVGFLFGLGGAYQFNRNFDVNLGFDMMTGDVSNTSYYAGMAFRF